MSEIKKFNIKVNGQDYDVEVQEISHSDKIKKMTPNISQTRQVHQDNGGNVVAPMPGVVTSLKVSVGDQVSSDQAVVTLEAMKMENEIPAGKTGTVKEINVKVGQGVAAGELLVVIE